MVISERIFKEHILPPALHLSTAWIDVIAGALAAILEHEDKEWQRNEPDGIFLMNFVDPLHQPWATYLQTSFMRKKN